MEAGGRGGSPQERCSLPPPAAHLLGLRRAAPRGWPAPAPSSPARACGCNSSPEARPRPPRAEGQGRCVGQRGAAPAGAQGTPYHGTTVYYCTMAAQATAPTASNPHLEAVVQQLHHVLKAVPEDAAHVAQHIHTRPPTHLAQRHQLKARNAAGALLDRPRAHHVQHNGHCGRAGQRRGHEGAVGQVVHRPGVRGLAGPAAESLPSQPTHPLRLWS